MKKEENKHKKDGSGEIRLVGYVLIGTEKAGDG